MNYFIHESAYVDEPVEIGEGSKVWHFSHIQSGAKIGRNCVFGQNVNVGPNVVIGNNVKIQNNVSVYEGVVLEDDVFCGPSIVFTNIVNPRSAFPQRGKYVQTLVRQGATIGANATIVCGVTVGRCAFVGAGAVVTKDVPDFALIVGNPGRQLGWMSHAGQRLSFSQDGSAICPASGRSYKLESGIIVEL